MGITPLRAIRISDKLWSEAKRATAKTGESITDVVRRALQDYVDKHRGT